MVWSKPLRHLGPNFGVTDTALRKKCKKASIPLPTAGYWAKKAANKHVNQPSLPPRLPGCSIYIEIGSHHYIDLYSREIVLNSPIPPPPYFEESIDMMYSSICRKVDVIAASSLNKSQHPLIAKHLNEDTQRQNKEGETGYMWLKPRFKTSIQRRKLRIISAIFNGAIQLSGKPYIRISKHDYDIQDASVQFGEIPVSLIFSEIIKKDVVNGKTVSNSYLKLALDGYSNYGLDTPIWEDSNEKKIEDSLFKIIIEITLGAEIKYRAHEKWKYENVIQRRAEYIEEDIQEQREQEQVRLVQIKKVQQAQIDELLEQAENLQKARIIRDYVTTIEQSSSEFAASSKEISNWCIWAREQANRIAPLRQESFMKQVKRIS